MSVNASNLGAPPAAPARRRYTWKRLIVFCITVFALSVLILLGGIYFIVGLRNPQEENPIKQSFHAWENPGSVAFATRPRLNILVMGVDYNYTSKDIHFTKYARSDTMFVMSVDKDAKNLNIVSIARDLWVDIPGRGQDKINAAFSTTAEGNVDLAKRTVEQLLGISIDHYIVIKEYAARKLVDAIGGVTLDVEKNMDYDDTWGHLHIHLKKGLQRLNGEEAVGYCRFRHDWEGDRGRMRRQQQFLSALLKQLCKPENITLSRIRQITSIVKENLQTDLSFQDLLDLALVYKNFNRKKMETAKIDGTDDVVDGQDVIRVDEAAKDRVVDHLLLGDTRPVPEDVGVEILNGSQVNGAANALADVFRQKGYRVVNVGNDPNPNEPETYMIDHKNNEAVCDGIEKTFFGQINVYYTPQPDAKADVTVVLGRDWPTRYKAYDSTSVVVPPVQYAATPYPTPSR